MNEVTYAAAFLVGLAGSVHCLGMCGGVVSAFTFATPAHANKEIYAFAYNLGRISTYTSLGAITGFIGSIFSSNQIINFPVLNYISILFVFLLALYISDLWKVLSHLERAGTILWKKVQPLSKKLVPVKSPFYAIGYGAVWGLLPCGLIYSALTWSLAAGGALEGAIMMLAFGLGTLPSLLIVSFGFHSIVPLLKSKKTRSIVASMLAASGFFLLYRQIQGTVI